MNDLFPRRCLHFAFLLEWRPMYPKIRDWALRDLVYRKRFGKQREKRKRRRGFEAPSNPSRLPSFAFSPCKFIPAMQTGSLLFDPSYLRMLPQIYPPMTCENLACSMACPTKSRSLINTSAFELYSFINLFAGNNGQQLQSMGKRKPKQWGEGIL